MVAIDPSGHGDVSQSEVRYKRTKMLPYVPTPLAYQNYVFLWCDHGAVCCVEPTTGKDLWTKRVGGDFSGSPIGAGGMLFNIDEQGNVVVLAAGPEFKLLGKLPVRALEFDAGGGQRPPVPPHVPPFDVRRGPAVAAPRETAPGRIVGPSIQVEAAVQVPLLSAPPLGFPLSADGRFAHFLVFQGKLPRPRGRSAL
jgi:hypothetical protein